MRPRTLPTKSVCFAETYLAVLEQISKETFGLGFLPLALGTEKQVCNILGKGGWKVLQKNRKKDTKDTKEKAAKYLLVSLHLAFSYLRGC